MAAFNNYTKEVLKRFTDPQNFGEIENPDGVGQVGNPKCGDVMRIYIKVENNIIKDIKFQTFGCVSAIASSDALCEIAKGKTIEEAKKINNKEIIDKLEGLPSVKVHCSVLGASGLRKAIEDYERRIGKKISPSNEDQEDSCCSEKSCAIASQSEKKSVKKKK